MLKGAVSSFLLCSTNYLDMIRLPNAIFRGLHYPFISYSSFLLCVSGGYGLLFTGYGLLFTGYGLLFTRCGHLLRNGTHSAADDRTEWTIAYTHLKRRLKNWSSLWKDSVTTWRWHLEAESRRGNLLSTIKTAYSALEYLLDIFHLIRKSLGTKVKTEKFYSLW
jgi:hypothetical protein